MVSAIFFKLSHITKHLQFRIDLLWVGVITFHRWKINNILYSLVAAMLVFEICLQQVSGNHSRTSLIVFSLQNKIESVVCCMYVDTTSAR